MSKKKPVKRGANTAAPWVVGRAYFIRTVTMHVVGRLEAVHQNELVLVDAAWAADSGRFNNALKTGALAEVEPFVDSVIIGRGSIVDATQWRHALPRETK